MNNNIMLGVAFGMAFCLMVAVAIYAFYMLPEISEYNEHLSYIKSQAEKCNCTALTVVVYPDYYNVTSHEEAHRLEGI